MTKYITFLIKDNYFCTCKSLCFKYRFLTLLSLIMNYEIFRMFNKKIQNVV
jgi:hypothetical protein